MLIGLILCLGNITGALALDKRSVDPIFYSKEADNEKSEKININTASAELLAKKLKGIGLKKAQRIVDYRDKYGLFTSIEQLAEVSGISQSIVEQNISVIAL